MASALRPRRTSRWRKVIDRCPQRAAHLGEAVHSMWEDECFIGSWSLGREAVLACLEHTFGLGKEQLSGLRDQIDAERDEPEPDRPQYRGGHPAIPEGSEWEGWYSTADLGELIEGRAEELDRPDESFGSILSAHYLRATPDAWTCSLEYRRLGDTGWLTVDYIDENENYVTGILGSWTPFADEVAMHGAVLDAFPSWWFRTAPGSDADTFRGRVPLLVEGLVALCRSDWVDAKSECVRISRYAVANLAARHSVSRDTWDALGFDSIPAETWWSSLSAATLDARCDEESLRHIVALYVALHLDGEVAVDSR